MTRKIITLTTDFGYDSTYVGAMKGAIYSLYPDALLVDLTHSVRPQQVLEGAFLVYMGYRDFPSGTIHVTVVDPGVGTNRRAVCVQVPEVGYFIGPDNGLFSYLLDTHARPVVREITNPAFMRHPISATFHGRDIFAPTAALLARGESFEEVGPLLGNSTLARLDNIWPQVVAGSPSDKWQAAPLELMLQGFRPQTTILSGQVVHIDHYGNLITNISRQRFDEQGFSVETVGIEVEQAHRVRGVRQTYGYAQPDEMIALFGSNDFLEVARVNGRADNCLGKVINVGQTVRLIRGA